VGKSYVSINNKQQIVQYIQKACVQSTVPEEEEFRIELQTLIARELTGTGKTVERKGRKRGRGGGQSVRSEGGGRSKGRGENLCMRESKEGDGVTDDTGGEDER
jgi:hypothetical protein